MNPLRLLAEEIAIPGQSPGALEWFGAFVFTYVACVIAAFFLGGIGVLIYTAIC